VEQLRIIFNNFGILTEYSEQLAPITKKVKVTSMNYRISTNSDYALRYFKEIGFRFKRKTESLKKYNIRREKINKMKHCGVCDNIPNGIQTINKIYEEIKKYGKLNELKNNGIKIRPTKEENDKTISSRKTILKLIEYERKNLSPDLLNEINSYVNENIVWVKIKEISKSKNYTYDFSLPSTPKEANEFNHSIIYNQFITHQTPNGRDETFYKIFEGAKKKNNEFKAVELWWFNDPRYNVDLEWIKNKEKENEIRLKDEDWSNERRIKMFNDGWVATSPWFEKEVRNANGDMRKIAQEILCVFGDSLITIRDVNTKTVKTVKISELYEILYEEKNLLNNKNFEILDSTGVFVPFLGIIKSKKDFGYKVTLENKDSIIVGSDHIFMAGTKNMYVTSLIPKITYITTLDGDFYVESIERVEGGIFMILLIRILLVLLQITYQTIIVLFLGLEIILSPKNIYKELMMKKLNHQLSKNILI
jgi:hypothetical protein